MTVEYEPIEIKLKWNTAPEGVSVKWPAVGNEWSPSSPLPDINIPRDDVTLQQLASNGAEIARLLFPQQEMRDHFWGLFDSGKKIRLKLIYERSGIENLLSVQWEYIYLTKEDNDPPDDTDPPSPAYLLGIKEAVSIVHCLPKSETAITRPIAVSNLPFNVLYISSLRGEEGGREIAQEFKEKVENLETIVNYDIQGNPDSFDVEMGILDDCLVHITSHGNPHGSLIGENDLLTALEMQRLFDSALNPQVKVVIFLSCNGGGAGMAARLHQHAGVSAVIGMTGTIYPDPGAKNFVRGFYYGLNRPDEGIERCVSLGRLSIFNRGRIRNEELPEETQWDPGFGLPRLFLNTPDSTLIPERLLYTPVVTDMVPGFRQTIDSIVVEDYDDDNTKTWQEKMKAWVNRSPGAPQPDWLLVTGPAGEGKTTQLKLLLNSLKSAREPCQPNSDTPNPTVCPQKILFHFCDDEELETCRALNFVCDSLVPQLHDLYGQDYINAIPDGRFPRLVHNADLALWDFVITPLAALIKDQKIEEPLIVIDGLDVVPEFQDPANTISGLLFRYQDRLEEVARFLVSADYVELSSRDIDGRQAERPNEVSTNIYELTRHEHNDDDIIRIVDPDVPSILFQVMVERLKDGDLEPSTIPERRQWRDFYNLLDLAVEKAIDVAVKDTRHLEAYWQKHLLRLLNIVAIAFEPLPSPDVAAIAGLSPDGPEKKYLLSILSPFFNDIEADEANGVTKDNAPLSLYHKRLKRYLLSEMRYKYDKESLADTHMLLVDAFRPGSGQWADLNWHTLAGSNWPRLSEEQINSIVPYLQRYYVYHAYYGCYYTSWGQLNVRRRRAKAFLDLICDSDFRKMRKETVGRRLSLQDIWLGLRVINAEYIHYGSQAQDHNHTNARVAFDRLLAANRPNSYRQDELIKLERKLRINSDTDWKDLFKFLNFNTDSQIEWWSAFD